MPSSSCLTCWEKALTSLEIILAAQLEEDAEKDEGQTGKLPGCQRLLSEQFARTISRKVNQCLNWFNAMCST